MQKKTDYWLGETIPTTKRFGTLTEEAAEEASAKHDDNKPPTDIHIGSGQYKATC